MNDADILSQLRERQKRLDAELAQVHSDIEALVRVDQLRQSFSRKSAPTASKPPDTRQTRSDMTVSDAVLAAVGDEWISLGEIHQALLKSGFHGTTAKAVYVAVMRWYERGEVDRAGKKGSLFFRRKPHVPKEET